jgi:polysaccharide pyruvyl transferase WcaK-like protein
MHIHLKGGDLSNKGDELMLTTVLDRFQHAGKKARLSVFPHYCAFEARSFRGLYQALNPPNTRHLMYLLSYPALLRYRRQFGLVALKDLEWCLDLSGFCYTDYWGPANTERMAAFMRRQAKTGTRFIFLPQAYGPFSGSPIRERFAEMARQATLMYVRDEASFQHILELGVNPSPLRRAPDLTTLAPSVSPPWTRAYGPYACVIPNSRLIEQGKIREEGEYVRFLCRAAEALRRAGLRPLLLLFEDKDLTFLQALRAHLTGHFDYVLEKDPVRLRGIIREAEAVLSSRYHGLVSALSQGTPCLGTSWSHKYEELLREYQCSEAMIADFSRLDAIELLADQGARAALRAKVSAAAGEMRQKALRMWTEIGQIMGVPNLDRSPDDEPAVPGPQPIGSAAETIEKQKYDH